MSGRGASLGTHQTSHMAHNKSEKQSFSRDVTPILDGRLSGHACLDPAPRLERRGRPLASGTRPDGAHSSRARGSTRHAPRSHRARLIAAARAAQGGPRNRRRSVRSEVSRSDLRSRICCRMLSLACAFGLPDAGILGLFFFVPRRLE